MTEANVANALRHHRDDVLRRSDEVDIALAAVRAALPDAADFERLARSVDQLRGEHLDRIEALQHRLDARASHG